MKWLASIFVGLCAAPLAAIIIGTAADSWARWLRMSSHEGAAGYWVVMMALLAAIAALVLGISFARGWVLTSPNFWSALGATVGWVAAIALVMTGIIWLAADMPPKIDGRRLDLVVEVRFPAGTTVESLKEAMPYVTIMRVDSGDSRGSGYFTFETSRVVDGQLIAPSTIDLYTSAKRKKLHLGYPDGRNLLFPLAFGSVPEAKDLEWSEWISAEADTTHAIRYKVALEPPPTPPLTREQQEAEVDAGQEAAMRALSPDAPLAQWLVYTRYGVSQPRIDAAVAAIRARPNYVADMTREMLAGEHDPSRDALRAIAQIKPPPAELAAAIATVGEEIAQALLDLEKEPADSETYNDHVAAISTRFSAWMEATRALQEPKLADFVPQLKKIIEPARRLDQAHAIRIDVVRVASFYLNKWAGIEPLPTDPPPR